MKTKELTLEEAQEYFRYDPETGKLFWKKNKGESGKIGQEAGSINKRTSTLYYRRVKFNGQLYAIHRIIWFLTHGHWPIHEIDHRNGNSLDNRLENLRDVTHLTNNRNKRLRHDNKSEINGVYWNEDIGDWCAYIKVNRHQIHLGSFPTKEAAAKARKEAEAKYGFSPRHGTKAVLIRSIA